MKIKFTVIGEPKAKGRPRFMQTVYGKPRVFTPKDTIAYENHVKMAYYNACGELKLNGGVKAFIRAVFPIPKSTSKKKAEEMRSGKIRYTKKIDCDNLAKSVLDALNKIAYDDDSQIDLLLVTKEYGDNPRVEVTLSDE